jgi:flagellar protein FlbD
MITLSRLNKEQFVLNADLIETVESTPDTVVTLTTGKKLMVKNSLEDVVDQVVKYRQLCNRSIQVIHKTNDAQ